MSIYQIFHIMRARMWVIILTLLVAVTVSSVVVMLLPERYTATSNVILDIAVPDPVKGQTMPTNLVRDHIRTQIRLIKSPRVAEPVVEALGLDRSVQYMNDFAATGLPPSRVRNWIADQLIDNLDVVQVQGSRILAISFSSSSPSFAANVVNEYTAAYIRTDLALRTDPAKRNAQWFSGELNNMKQALDDAQRRLTLYQQRTGIISVVETLDAESAKLVDLTERVTAARAEASDARSIVNQLEAFERRNDQSGVLPDFMTNSNIERWRDELTRIDAQFASIKGSVGPNHPTYKAVEAQRSVIDEQLTEEIAKLRRSIFGRVALAESKAESLESELNSQKEKLLRLRSDRDQLDALVREVEMRKAQYDSAFRRAGTLELEGAVAQTGVVILTEATPPAEHSFPKRTLSVSLAAAFGFVLGIALSFLLEMIDRRIRSTEDLEQVAGVSVYVTLGKSRNRRKSPGNNEPGKNLGSQRRNAKERAQQETVDAAAE